MTYAPPTLIEIKLVGWTSEALSNYGHQVYNLFNAYFKDNRKATEVGAKSLTILRIGNQFFECYRTKGALVIRLGQVMREV